MIHIVGHDTFVQYRRLLDQMFRLRAQQFHDRRKWKVAVRNDLEIDRFDKLDPVYVLVSDDQGNLLGSIRLLKTIGAHMLSDVFPDIMGSAPILRHPQVLECSRLCVDTRLARGYAKNGVNRVTQELLYGLFAHAHQSGLVNLVSVHDHYVDRILRRAGCVSDRIGKVITCDDDLKACASLFEVSQDVVDLLYRPDFTIDGVDNTTIIPFAMVRPGTGLERRP